MSGFEIYTPTAEEVHSGVLGRRMRQFNYGFVGEYGQSQPVWVSARDAQGELVGGLYGVSIGRMFYGESMFSTERDASKVALVHLVGRLKADDWNGRRGVQFEIEDVADPRMA